MDVRRVTATWRVIMCRAAVLLSIVLWVGVSLPAWGEESSTKPNAQNASQARTVDVLATDAKTEASVAEPSLQPPSSTSQNENTVQSSTDASVVEKVPAAGFDINQHALNPFSKPIQPAAQQNTTQQDAVKQESTAHDSPEQENSSLEVPSKAVADKAEETQPVQDHIKNDLEEQGAADEPYTSESLLTLNESALSELWLDEMSATALIESSSDGAIAADTPKALTVKTPEEVFPTSPVIERQKAFWIRIFTECTTECGLLHDGRVGLPVYSQINLKGLNKTKRRRAVRYAKARWSKKIRTLAKKIDKKQSLSAAEQSLLNRFGKRVTPARLRIAASEIRMQRGLSNRFYEGMGRATVLLDRYKHIMRNAGVPEDLSYLPHVESSFYNNTYSHVGAAGIWQFMRGTAKVFMRVDYDVDERLDPIRSAHSAAALLKNNYQRLGTWPLAITAYNHGARSLERIVARVGTKDLGTLIESYHQGSFRIASKNFYAEFLAAREVSLNPERYFPPVKKMQLPKTHVVKLPFYISAKNASRTIGISTKELRRLNPSLTYAIWSGSRHIPANFSLTLPAKQTPKRFLAKVPNRAKKKSQPNLLVVRVRRGDTLYHIGRRHGVSWRAIARVNKIHSSRRLRPGKKLVIPLPAGKKRKARVTKAANIAMAISPPVIAKPKRKQVNQQKALKSKSLRMRSHYGDSLWLYSRWSDVKISQLRQINNMRRRENIKPGRAYLIPSTHVSGKEFEKRRQQFYKQREKEFFAAHQMVTLKPIKVKMGQSVWTIAKKNNVPMWLISQKNPHMKNKAGYKPGNTLYLPVLVAKRK